MSPLLRKLLIALGVLILIGGVGAWLLHGNRSDLPIAQFEGTNPRLVDPQPETIPTISLAKTLGWAPGEKPSPAPGLTVDRWAEGLDHPRTMLTLPNGDVLVAETAGPAMGDSGGVTGFFQRLGMHFVGADVPSPDSIVLLRDSTGAGKADQRFVPRHGDGLSSPSGMAWGNGTLYVANHNAVLAFPYQPGATALTGAPRKIMDLPGGGN